MRLKGWDEDKDEVELTTCSSLDQAQSCPSGLWGFPCSLGPGICSPGALTDWCGFLALGEAEKM